MCTNLELNTSTYTHLGVTTLNGLAHGEFGEWLEKVGINHGVANKMMKISETHYLNYSHASNLGVTALYEIATLPEEEREKEHTASMDAKLVKT